ncbi:MAG: sigma-70 family RNA polymerase sigma factor [Solirubrobacteraceae bacterium]
MPSNVERSDGELLAAVVAGDGAAFATFYRRHLPTVVGFLLRETGDREATADLTAEVFAAIFLVAGRFRPRGPGSARPWVLGIARNKLLESRRRGRVEDREYGEIARELNCSELVARQRVSRGLSRLRDQMKERER